MGLAAAEIIEGERDVSELAAAIERGPVTLREIDSGRLYGMLGNPGRLRVISTALFGLMRPASLSSLNQLLSRRSATIRRSSTL